MGVTNEGLFVGLTNQPGRRGQGRTARSRGEVVLRTLEAGSLEAIERYLEALPGDEFLAFNLLYGDARGVRVAYARPGEKRLRREDVPPGIHVLPNDVLDSPDSPKVARARLLAAAVARLPWPELEAGLKALLADETLPDLAHVPSPPAGEDLPRDIRRQLQALCIHTPAYGTRSSAIVTLAPGRVGHYLSTETAPCQGAWRDVTGLLAPPAAAAHG